MHTVIFDVDDTLLHTHKVAYAKSVLAAKKLGVMPPTRAEFETCFGKFPFEECVRRWHPGHR